MIKIMDKTFSFNVSRYSYNTLWSVLTTNHLYVVQYDKGISEDYLAYAHYLLALSCQYIIDDNIISPKPTILIEKIV